MEGEEGEPALMEATESKSESVPRPPRRLEQRRSLETFDATLVAKHLTLVEFELFRRIESREFVDKNWMKANKHEVAPNALRFSERFNQVSMWVATAILQRRNFNDRRNLMRKFIEIGVRCKELNNVNAVFAIVGGLGFASVHRLKRTRAALPSSAKAQLEELQRISSTKDNFRAYREWLQTTNPPCIPYLGVFHTHLCFIEDGNPDITSTGLINFEKRRMLAHIIHRMHMYQQKPYEETMIPEIREALQDLPQASEDRLWALSLECEPRET